MERKHSLAKADLSTTESRKELEATFKKLENQYSLPSLKSLPRSLPLSLAIRIELSEGIPILKASESIHIRVEELLQKEREVGLSEKEEIELDQYEEIDDYLSFVNRVVRNIFYEQKES